VLAVFAGVSFWVLGVVLVQSGAANRVWTGAGGLIVSDQAQYLAWIRWSGEHGMVANPFRLDTTPADFLHPGVALSGLLVRLGASVPIAYLLWLPVAVVALFAAVRALVCRCLDGTAARRCALVLALFFTPLTVFFLDRIGLGTHDVISLSGAAFDLALGSSMWGYPFAIIAVAGLVAAVLVYERGRAAGRARAWAPLLGFLVAWLQPWQGTALIGILVAAEATLPLGAARRRVHLAGLLTTVGATAVPLAYYAVLGAADPSWELVKRANGTSWPLWSVLISIAPLALPALVAYRRRPRDFAGAAVRAWPVVSIGVFLAINLSGAGTFPIHAVVGLSIPLSILAVAGVRDILPATRPWVVAGGVAVAAMVVPVTLHQLDSAADRIDRGSHPDFFGPGDPYVIASDDADALKAVEHSPERGGVLASVYLGQLVPALTGRRTWVGNQSWTPGFNSRVVRAAALTVGHLPPGQARSFVLSTGARFTVLGCNERDRTLTPALVRALVPIAAAVRRFGCATVVEVANARPLVAGTLGLAPLERNGRASWRWAIAPVAALRLRDATGHAGPVQFSARLVAPPGGPRTVVVRYPDGLTVRLRVTDAGQPLTRRFALPASGGEVDFAIAGHASRAPHDPRPLYLQVRSMRLRAPGVAAGGRL